MTIERNICLCSVPFRVTEQDGQVIFEEQSDFPGCTRFTFEWKICGWYLVDFESSFHHVFAQHLVAAVKWIRENYHIEWDGGFGTVTLKPE